MSSGAVRSYIRQNPRVYADFFSELIEDFLFLSGLRLTLAACLFLSNVSNAYRTQDPLSLIVNLPSIILLLSYPFLRRRGIIPKGRGTMMSFLLTFLLSLQWGFSFWIFARLDVQQIGPTILTVVIAVLWLLSVGPSVLLNFMKAGFCTAFFVSIMNAINPDYVQSIKGSLAMGVILGIGLNQAMDQLLRFRFYVEEQQKVLVEKNARIELMMRTSQLIIFSINDRLEIRSDQAGDSLHIFGNTGTRAHLDGLLVRTDISAADKTAMKSALQAILNDSEISFTINEHACLKRFRLQTVQDGWRTMLASYAPLVTADGTITEILMALSDVTSLEDQQSRQKLASTETESLLILLRAPREQLALFMTEAPSLLTQLDGGSEPQHLMRTLHTFKGNCRALGFKGLAQLLHQTESSVHSGIGFDEEASGVRAILTRLLAIYHERIQSQSERSSLKQLIESLLQASALQICTALEKPLPVLHVHAPSELDTAALRKLLFQILPHLVANALDHGIEGPDERLASGKSASGNIHLTLKQDAALTLSFHDDGRGLSLSALRQRDKKNGRSDEELALDLLTNAGSSKSSVSEISGRGVGFKAVATAVNALGGCLAIRLGEPTANDHRQFAIELTLASLAATQVA